MVKSKNKLKKYLALKNILLISLFVLILVVIIFIGVNWGSDIWALFEDTERIREMVEQAGVFGPIIFIFLQAFQIIFAPIPGNVVGAVGGAIFEWWGVPLTIIGSIIGMSVVVAISKKFGRPLLDKLFKKDQVKKLDFILDHPAAEIVLFLIFLLPFLPDDIIGYLAGLTKIKFRNIIIISALGRLPVQILTNFFGAKLLDGNYILVIIILLLLVLMALLLYLKRNWVYGFLKTDNQIEYLKNSISRKKMVKSKNVSKDNKK